LYILGAFECQEIRKILSYPTEIWNYFDYYSLNRNRTSNHLTKIVQTFHSAGITLEVNLLHSSLFLVRNKVLVIFFINDSAISGDEVPQAKVVEEAMKMPWQYSSGSSRWWHCI
jgi:hypothetical protein